MSKNSYSRYKTLDDICQEAREKRITGHPSGHGSLASYIEQSVNRPNGSLRAKCEHARRRNRIGTGGSDD